MIVFLEIVPRWPLGSAPIRLCSAADRRVQAWDGKIWAAALSDPGALSQSLFSGDIGASIDSATGPVVLSASRLIASYPAAETVRWESASYKMWVGQFLASVSPVYSDHGPYGLSVSQVSQGKVVRFEAQDGAIKLSLDPAGEAGDTKVLDLEYAGTTGAEGGADRKGTLKPWVFGVALNVEPVLIDEDNSVYQFSGYGPIKAVDALYERGSSFGAAIGDYADYAALVAADIPAGRWGTCLAQGMIRLGAPQYGVITGDVQGDYADGILRRKPGEILQRIAAQRSISTDTIDTDSLDALDDFAATLPAGGNINLVISDQIGFLDLARRLCAPFNAQAGYSLMGELFACRVTVGTPTFTIHSQGKRLPVVSDFVEADTPPPFKRIVMSGNISWRVHDLANDVAFYATPKERGIYDDAETYREGDIVSIADGSRWIYVNPTATTGNDPADGSAYWNRMSGAATGPQGPAGADGSSVTMVFKRAASQPSTPSPGLTKPPAGWYDDVASVPASSDPLWGCIGSQDDPTSNWVWYLPVQIEGQDGAPGVDGADGVTYYTHYAYADAPDGTFNFTTGSPGDRTFQGVRYNQTSATESTNPADYSWSPYVGPPNFGLAAFNSNTPIAGNKLIKATGATSWGNASVHSTESFKGGASVSFVIDSAADRFMAGLNTDPTTDANYTSIDFAIYIHESSIRVYESGSSVLDTGIAPVVGDVFTITYNNKTVVYSKNGVPFYTNSAPSANLTLFLDTALYTANRTFGRILSFAAAGPAGADGSNGLNNAVVYLYQRGASAPAAPSGTFTYTFATGALSGGTLNGWTQAIPAANGSPLWVIAATASAAATTDSIAAAEFTSPVLKDGAGLNGAPVFLYKRAASAPSVPASTLTYTFATGVLSGTLSGWTQSVPANDGNPVYIITATALGTGTTDTIATGEWSTPQILAADGADGSDGLPGLTISASPPVFAVARTAGGAPKSGELPKPTQIKVFDGTTDVTASATFSKADTGCSVSNGGGGAFSLTALSAEDAYTIITATYGGRSIPIKVAVAQPKDGSAASRATASVTSMNASGTYTAIATVDIVAAAGATISGNASTTYLAASFVGTGTRTVRQQAKVSIQNLTDGGAEVDGAAQIGSAASYIGGDGPSDVGQVSASNYVTNSSGAPKTFRLKFYIRYYDGATTAQTAGGTYSGNIEAQVA
ncbi:MAG: hypothetical protein ACTHNA_14110 [Sphingopyxis terrae]|uniref:hypothetical protein n=1 Tax=Sphingopyxis terrae TaxID=33052 RepID=UPI003F7D3846